MLQLQDFKSLQGISKTQIDGFVNDEATAHLLLV